MRCDYCKRAVPLDEVVRVTVPYLDAQLDGAACTADHASRLTQAWEGAYRDAPMVDAHHVRHGRTLRLDGRGTDPEG